MAHTEGGPAIETDGWVAVATTASNDGVFCRGRISNAKCEQAFMRLERVPDNTPSPG
jgi:hypothetical protein